MRILTRSLSRNTQLYYEVKTVPFPLQASPADTTLPLTTAAITVVASNQGNHAVEVSSIQISFDIAPAKNPDDATYLTSIGSGITFQVMGDSEQKIWSLSNDGNGTLTAKAVGASVSVLDQGIALTASGIQPNRSVGSFILTITETLASGDKSKTEIELSKFPYAFFMDNFRADALVVSQGQGTTLRWDASGGTRLHIIYGGGMPDVSKSTSWPTGALTADTAFMLQASIGDVALATLSLTVQVVQPVLDLTSLTVEGASTLKGAVAAQSTLGVTGNTTVGGTLTVTSAATLSGGTTVTGPVAATGAIAGASLSVTGQVSASTMASAASLSIGPWTFSIDHNGHLMLSNPAGAKVLFSSSGDIVLNGNSVITNNQTVWISNDQGWLNGSSKFPSHGADGFNAGTYWQNGPPDGDSRLKITNTPPT